MLSVARFISGWFSVGDSALPSQAKLGQWRLSSADYPLRHVTEIRQSAYENVLHLSLLPSVCFSALSLRANFPLAFYFSIRGFAFTYPFKCLDAYATCMLDFPLAHVTLGNSESSTRDAALRGSVVGILRIAVIASAYFGFYGKIWNTG